jgi:hypothetical protein
MVGMGFDGSKGGSGAMADVDGPFMTSQLVEGQDLARQADIKTVCLLDRKMSVNQWPLYAIHLDRRGCPGRDDLLIMDQETGIGPVLDAGRDRV